MNLDLQNQSTETIFQQIGAIIRELEALRQSVVAIQISPSSSVNLAQKLVGALGQGSWAEYDLDRGWN
jgi:hypothetical protein